MMYAANLQLRLQLHNRYGNVHCKRTVYTTHTLDWALTLAEYAAICDRAFKCMSV
jgi:hypothetical protein